MSDLIRFPKMSLLCGKDEYRLCFSYVCITKKYVIATNGWGIVRHPTSELFNPAFIEVMPDKMFVNRINWKHLEKAHILTSFANNQIEVFYEGYSICIPCKDEDSIGGKYPDIQELYNEKTKPVSSIGITPFLMDEVSKAMFRPYEIKQMNLVFNGVDKAIKITNAENGCEAILMPVLISK